MKGSIVTATILGISSFILFVLSSCDLNKDHSLLTLPPSFTDQENTPLSEPLPLTPSPSTPTLEYNTGKEIIICVEQEPQTLYRFNTVNHTEKLVLGAIYDDPIDYSVYPYKPVMLTHLPTLENGDVQVRSIIIKPGDLIFEQSTSLPISYQGTETILKQIVVTFTLRDDIFWADGYSVTAHDLQYAFDILKNSNTPNNPYPITLTSQYQAIGDFQIQWEGIPGYLTHNYLDLFIPPLPQHQLRQFQPQELTTTSETTQYPLGWGPFKVSEWKNRNSLTLIRNPYYFQPSHPLVDKIIFRFINYHTAIGYLISEDPEQSQRCDVVITHQYNDPTGGEIINDLVELGLVQVHTYPIAWDHLDFVFKEIEGFGLTLSDLFFRQAVAIAIDPTKWPWVNNLRLPPLAGLVGVGHPLATDPHFREAYPYDPSRAKELLSNLGLQDTDGDGFRDYDNHKLILKVGYLKKPNS